MGKFSDLRKKAHDEFELKIRILDDELQKKLEAIKLVEDLDAGELPPSNRGWVDPPREPSLAEVLRQIIWRLPGIYDANTIRGALERRYPNLSASTSKGSLSGTIARIVEENDWIEIIKRGAGRTTTTYMTIRDHNEER